MSVARGGEAKVTCKFRFCRRNLVVGFVKAFCACCPIASAGLRPSGRAVGGATARHDSNLLCWPASQEIGRGAVIITGVRRESQS